jgi:ribosomal protein L11
MAAHHITENKQVYTEFKEVVNMTSAAISTWLDTPESKKVGQTEAGSSESIGHHSGKKIIEILRKKEADLTDDDYAHMHKVISYVRRHSAQKPAHVEGSNWLYSLKNWGHDPEK